MKAARLAAPLSAALALTASVLASSPWLRGFDGSLLLPHVFVATAIAFALPLVVCYIAPRLGPCVAALSAPLFVLYAVFAVLRSPTDVALVWRALTTGPARLLSATMPFSEPAWLVVVPVAACWITGALAGESLARGRGIGFPVVLWVTSFGTAYAVTVDGPGSATRAAVSLTAVAGAFVLARRWAVDNRGLDVEREPLPASRLVFGAGGLVLVVVAAACTPALYAFDAEPTGPNRDPAVEAPAPMTPIRVIAQMRADAVDDNRVLFVVETDARSAGYVAVAELDSYDGDAWRFFRTFSPTGGRVPVPVPDGIPEVTQRYRVEDLRGLPWMPYIPTARQVGGTQARYDPATGMIMPESPLRPGDRYSVHSVAIAETLTRIPADEAIGAGSSNNARDALPPVTGDDELRAAVDALAEDLAVSRHDPLEFVRALTARLHTYGRTDPAIGAVDEPAAPAGRVAAGTSLGDVLNTVLGRRRGTPEQYATVLTLVARDLHVPARLVTGFRLVASSDAHPLPPGKYEVRASDAWTWVEIATDRGWVVADPSPDSADATTPTTAGASAIETTTTIPATVVVENAAGEVAPAARVPPRKADDVPFALLIGIAGAFVVTVALLLPVTHRVRRARRRRSRRSGTAAQRVLGAWHETLESMAEVLDDPLHALTASEVAEIARTRFGARAGNHAVAVGRFADVVLFAPALQLADTDAENAWETTSALRRCLQRGRPLGERLRGLLRVRSVSAPA